MIVFCFLINIWVVKLMCMGIDIYMCMYIYLYIHKLAQWFWHKQDSQGMARRNCFSVSYCSRPIHLSLLHWACFLFHSCHCDSQARPYFYRLINAALSLWSIKAYWLLQDSIPLKVHLLWSDYWIKDVGLWGAEDISTILATFGSPLVIPAYVPTRHLLGFKHRRWLNAWKWQVFTM